MSVTFVSCHQPNCLLNLTLCSQVLNKIAKHLFDARQQVFDSVKSQEVLLVGLLVEIAPKEEPHTVFHNSLFYFWEVVNVKAEVLDQSCCLFAVVVGAQLPDELNLESIVLRNKELGSLKLVHVSQFKHDSLTIEVLLELVSHNHQRSIINAVLFQLLFGYV